MKTKRHSRMIALLLVLCLCVTMLPGTVIAQEAEAPVEAKRELTMEDVLAGIADLSDLENPLEPDTVPEIIGYEEALEKYHAKRVYADEGDELNKVVFENLDGTKTMYLFDFPVKYVDTNGEIQDISLDIADSASGAFETAGNSTVTTFSAQASGGISLSGNGTNITLVPIMPTVSTGTQTMTAGSNAGNLGSISAEETVISHAATRIDEKTIQYRYDSKTTIEYSLTYTGFKEDIVVSEYTGQTEYAFTLRTGGYGLEEIDGSYFLVDDGGNIKATIGDIIIFTADERNNTMGSIVPTTIVENEEYLLTIVVDPDFLADENTAYPIRIDPTVEINYDNNGAGAIQDATVYTDDTTNGSLGSIFVGLKQNGGIARILMKFPGLDLSSLGDGVQIESATVTLRDLLCESTSLDVYCHVYAGAVWNESNVCWDNTIAVSPNYLSDYLDMRTVSYSIGTALSEQHRYSFDITQAVQGWMDGNYDQNKGIVFKANSTVENGSTYNWRTMGSYNRASYKPTLNVTYTSDNYQFIDNGTYYLNNDNTGKYLRYNAGSASGISGLLANLGTSIQWEIQNSSNGSGYVIRAKNDTTKYLGVSANMSSGSVEMVTVSNTAIPSRCIWSITVANGGGCLVRNIYNSKYLYSSGTYLYTSSTTGTVGTSTYYSRVWRITSISRYSNTSSSFYGELDSGTTISDLIVNIGETQSPTINAVPSNVLWAEKTDFVFSYSSGASGCVTISLPSNVFSGVKCGIATYVATHKVTGRMIAFTVDVRKLVIYQAADTEYHDEDGLLAEDLVCGDLSAEALVALSSIDESLMECSPDELKNKWESLAELMTSGALTSVAHDMIDHFMQGSGDPYSNAALTEAARNHNSTQVYVGYVEQYTKELIAEYAGDILALAYDAEDREDNPLRLKLYNNGIYQPVYNTLADKVNGLVFCLHSLWGNKIEISEFTVSDSSYTCTVHFTLYDHFGLDQNDIESHGQEGFCAWYILQHYSGYNSAYRPFLTLIEFDITFTGSI